MPVIAPQGTVTLVFTDIQGSTALWEHFGDDFKALLDLHNALFRAAIDEFGGYEVQTIGDAFMIAFQDAGSAVAMCLAMQERLQEAEWPDALNDVAVVGLSGTTEDGRFRGLRVRMGVHTGNPDCQLDPVTGRMDYFGPMVNRAARVCDVGHGGQLVVSQATWEATGSDGLPEGTVVEDLGEHALKGLERRREHLRQALPGTLAGRTLPRLKTPNLKKTNLPTRLDSFFGRERELSELTQRIAGGQRLITVLGAGGMGKTRLSQHFGGTQLGDFAGGVWFCDLTETQSRSGILSAMASALEVPLTGKDPAEQLADVILDRGRVLVILDNFEQVVDQAPDTVGSWLQRAPEAVFLATSRAPLHISGEKVFLLDPRPTAEAVNLFYDRARAVLPDFVRTKDNEPVVTEIVERLDCMSLALELAAARVRMLPPRKILSRLSQRFKLLRGQRRDQPARQATLRGAIDWSWELLKPHERSALAQLSVFHGGCTLESAEAVVNLERFEDEPWVPDLVEALIDHSLLRRVEPYPGHVRYRMLESIREYAAEKLGEETAATSLRHGSHFASLGNETHLASLRTHGGVERRKALALELQNLLAGVDEGLAAGEWEGAASCALAAAEVLLLHGPYSDAIALLDRFSDQPVCPATRVGLVHMTAWLLYVSGRLAEALEHYHQALALVRKVGNRLTERGILGNLATLHWKQGRLAESLERRQQALAIHREVGSRRDQGNTLGNLGLLYQDLGRVSDAQEHQLQALAIAREIGDRRLEGNALGNSANVLEQQGRPAEALAQFHQALAIARELGNRGFEGLTLGNIGNVHFRQGHIPQALEHYHESLAIHQAVGNRPGMGITLGKLANLHRHQGRIPEALEHYHRALGIHREVSNRNHEGITLRDLGEMLFGLGDLPAAEPHLQEAIAICDEPKPLIAGVSRASLALLRAQQGAFKEARALLDKGEPQVRGVHKLDLGKLLCKKARVEHLAGDPDAASTALAEAESIVAELEVTPNSELSTALAEARNALTR